MKRFVILCLLPLYAVAYSQSAVEIREYIAKYSAIALEQEREFGIPASITLAQGILESAAGTSQLTKNTNNHFGIKALGNWRGSYYLAWDDEPVKSRFRIYSNADDSFRDHSRVLKDGSRYRDLFRNSVYDYRSWAVGLQTAGYATAPNYAKALIGYIDAYALYSLNGGVKLRPGTKVTITTTELVKGEVDWKIDDSEVTEEEEEINNVVSRYVVAINDIRCTLLYPGQTLSTIAQKYNLPKKAILEYNEVRKEEDIAEGSVVFLERKRTRYGGIQDYYRAKEGDTMYSVSQQFGVRLESLKRLNNKIPASGLKPGNKIRLK